MKGLPYSRRRGAQSSQSVSKQTINFTKTFTVVNGSSADGVGTVVIGDFPTGKIVLLATRLRNCVFKTASANATSTFNGHVAIGSAPAVDVTVSGTKGDLVASAALGAATAKVSPTQDITASKALAVLDNADGSLEVNLNCLVDDASQSGDIVMSVTGVLELNYAVL